MTIETPQRSAPEAERRRSVRHAQWSPQGATSCLNTRGIAASVGRVQAGDSRISRRWRYCNMNLLLWVASSVPAPPFNGRSVTPESMPSSLHDAGAPLLAVWTGGAAGLSPLTFSLLLGLMIVFLAVFARWNLNRECNSSVVDFAGASQHRPHAQRPSSQHAYPPSLIRMPSSFVVPAGRLTVSLPRVPGGFPSKAVHVDVLRSSGAHSFVPCDVAATTRPLFCNGCHNMLSGLSERVYTCEVCQLYVHESCAQVAARSCSCKALVAESTATGAANEGGDSETKTGGDSSSGGVDDHGSRDGDVAALLEHHWVAGNLEPGAQCARCRTVCASAIDLSGQRCVWCRITVHDDCVKNIDQDCDRGSLRRMVLPPSAFARRSEGRDTGAVDGHTASKPAGRGKRKTRASATGHGGSGSGSGKSLSQRFRRRVTHAVARVAARLQPKPQAAAAKWQAAAPPFDCVDVPSNVTPTVVLVNRGSGGRIGGGIIAVMRQLLHPLQVGDIGIAGPAPVLYPFRRCRRLRILACGGDGTVGWVLSTLGEMDMACEPAVGVLPLGTGNDLAQVLRWGKGFSGGLTEHTMRTILREVSSARIERLDRWSVRVRDFSRSELKMAARIHAAVDEVSSSSPVNQAPLRRRHPPFVAKDSENGGVGAAGSGGKGPRWLPEGTAVPSVFSRFGSKGASQPLKPDREISMVNYLGIGVGARVALEFHHLRQAYPKLFCSRLFNKVLYSQVGGLEILRASCATLYQTLRLECDGRPIPLPEGVQGVIVLNIASYGGGADLWGRAASSSRGASARRDSDSPDSSDDDTIVAFNDGVLEVVAVTGSFHLAKLQVGLSRARRLAQCRQLRIWTAERLPMQVDGEPHEQPPGVIEVNHLDQPTVLVRSENALHRAAAVAEDVLRWGVDADVIDTEQSAVLADELRRRLDEEAEADSDGGDTA